MSRKYRLGVSVTSVSSGKEAQRRRSLDCVEAVDAARDVEDREDPYMTCDSGHQTHTPTLDERPHEGYGVHMITRRFDRAFGRLLAAFTYHQDVPRNSANVLELGAARWELEIARNAMAVERRAVTDHHTVTTSWLRRSSVSEDDMARLRVFGSGTVSS